MSKVVICIYQKVIAIHNIIKYVRTNTIHVMCLSLTMQIWLFIVTDTATCYRWIVHQFYYLISSLSQCPFNGIRKRKYKFTKYPYGARKIEAGDKNTKITIRNIRHVAIDMSSRHVVLKIIRFKL